MAVVLFFVLLGIMAFDHHPDGFEWDYQSFGLAASCALTIIVNLQVSISRINFTISFVISKFDYSPTSHPEHTAYKYKHHSITPPALNMTLLESSAQHAQA